MKNIAFIILALGTLFFTACEETIELDQEQAVPIYVVHGLVTNESKQHFVKLSKSIGFYDTNKLPPVTDAEISVSDNNGNVYNYTYSEEDSTYYSDQVFQGVIGHLYSMNINADGDEITAQDTLKRVTPIDAVKWEIDEDEQEDPDKEGYFYEITLSAKEPKETTDYYLFHFFRNDTVQRFDNESGVFVADDIIVQEDIDDLPAPVYYKEGDKATFEMLSLTESSYKYYSDLSFLMTNDGGMFSSIPANPVTNLKGAYAVGYFQVSAIDRMTIIVGDPEHKKD